MSEEPRGWGSTYTSVQRASLGTCLEDTEERFPFLKDAQHHAEDRLLGFAPQPEEIPAQAGSRGMRSVSVSPWQFACQIDEMLIVVNILDLLQSIFFL